MAIKKYKNPRSVILGGYRRLSKTELHRFGYSEKSVLYTNANSKRIERVFTRSTLKRYGFSQYENYKTEKIRSKLIKNVVKYDFIIYSDVTNPLTLKKIYKIIQDYFLMLKAKFKPKDLDQLGLIFYGENNNNFSRQPFLWRDKDATIGFLLKKQNPSKAEKILQALGWIEIRG